jgi:hypothetical protein
MIFQNVIAQPQFLVYENLTHGIRIQYPSDWTRVELIADDPRVIRAAAFEFMAPQNTPSRVSSIVTITSSVLPNNMTVDEFISRLDSAIRLFGSPVNFESRSGSLAGLPAIERSFDFEGANVLFRLGDNDFKVIQIITSVNNEVYAITYMSPSLVFQRDLPIAQHMIDSFEIIRQ